MSTVQQLSERLCALLDAAGFNQRQAAYAIGRTPSRLGDYLEGRTIPSALVLMDLEEAAEQASRRQWMRAADVVDAVAEHAADDPTLAIRLLLQGRDQSRGLKTPVRQAIWATGSPQRKLPAPWKTLTHAVLRDTATDGRPVPRWLTKPKPLSEQWAPLPVRANRPVDESLANLGITINTRELVTL